MTRRALIRDLVWFALVLISTGAGCWVALSPGTPGSPTVATFALLATWVLALTWFVAGRAR